MPPNPPTIIDKIPADIKRAGWMLFEIMYINEMGASFCHVVISNAVCSVVPCSTSGSQK